ncbi:MAG: carboxypeptidase regulatory-like domain-containing protein [Verrucomicrobia bacterium]|nr:carboxypeptidase regulatory-like domain-containing protein [Verrucomicrobiota bacterium]
MKFPLCRWFLACVFTLVLAGVARAANPPPSQVFYVPFPEVNQLAGFFGINSAAADPLAVFVNFSVSNDSTVIYYDHWEDGYEADITNPKQATTEVWGDGNPANGYPPGNAGDLLAAGTVFSLRNFVTSTAGASVFKYDARDKIASYKPITLTKTSYPAVTNSLLAGSIEVFEQGLWGTEYRAPVGTNMPTSTPTSTLTYDADMFDYTSLSIMAGAGGASVQIDANNDGSFEQTVSLAEGGSAYVTNVSAGGRVLSTRPVQVVMFTGRPTSNYMSRDTCLLPTYRWSSSYYAPVSTTATYGTAVFLYNPGVSAITVTYDYRSTTSAYTTATVSVPAGGNARVTLVPSDSSHGGAYHFYTSGATFYAFCAVDGASSSTSNNQAYDGGFTLVGQASLTTQVQVSLGIGRDPYSTVNPTENGNPVWITTVGNGHTQTTVYVDYNGDNAGSLTDPNGNKYDVAYSLRELQQQKLFDPDGDQSGMVIYTLNPNVKIAAAWAQDPLVASAGAPGLDVATLITPLREGDAAKRSTVVVDADADGYCSAGDTLEYDIRVINTSHGPMTGPFTVKDTVPANTTYVAGSTQYRFSVNGAWQAWVSVPDDGSGTAFPLDGSSGYGIPGTLGYDQQIQLTFRAVITTYPTLTPSGTSAITNTGTVEITPYGLTVPFSWSDVLYGSIGDRVWIDADGDGVQDSGETGLNGVIVYADLNNNGVWNTGEPTATTAGDGTYVLKGLLAGTYTVRVNPASVAAIDPGYGPTGDLDGIATSYVATVALAAAQDRIDADFGFRIGASVGDRVWVDLDGDGVQDSGEPGINGVRVYIDSTTSGIVGSYDVGEPNSITFGDGTYYIGNLPAGGTYKVRIDTLPSGTIQTYDLDGTGTPNQASVTFSGAEHNPLVDFGYRGSLSIGDLVWEDVNADGANTVTYNVYNGRVDLNGSGAADNNDDGFIGTMRIINGYADTNNSNSISSADTGTFLGKTIIAGGFDMNTSGTITSADTGTVSYAAESGIANVKVYIDSNGNGVRDSNEAFATTDSSGIYSINNLFPGTYSVRVDTTTLPTSMVETYDLTSPTSDHQATVVLSGTSRTDVDFGYRNDATIGDRVWNDMDNDGVQDTGEPGIQGVTVYIDANGNGVFDQGVERYAITDLNGIYTINNLAAGTYAVRVDIGTLPQGSTETYDLTTPTTDNAASRTLTTSEDATNVDFGYRSTASIGDFVWLDTDADGVQDAGEAGLNAVRVYLDINGNGSFDSATEPSATTNSSGAYAIPGLVAGNYTARVDTNTLTTGLVQTYDLAGGLDNAATFILSAAQARTDLDFGYTQRVTIGDYVWNDTNANGVQDSGESGLDGVTVTVYNATYNTVAGTTTTSGGGAYSFPNLLPGTYYVVFDALAGYSRTLADQGGDDTKDSDANASTGKTGNVTLPDGAVHTNITLDAGYYQPATLGNQIWSDTNNNGIFDSGAGEAGINGVLVELYLSTQTPGSETPYQTTTSAGGGLYQFSNVPPGSYKVYIPASNFGTGAVLANTPLSSVTTNSSDDGTNNDDNGIQSASGAAVTSPLIALTAGETDDTLDFGFVPNGSIGNRVFDDHDNDGNLDAGEHGIAGVHMALFAADLSGNPTGTGALQTTITDDHGDYRFDGLVAGSYVVVVDKAISPLLAGYVTSTGYSADLTLMGDMRDHGKDTPVSVGGVTNGIATMAVTLGLGPQPLNEVVANAPGAGQHGPNGDLTDNLMLDFGFTPTYSIGNRVFLDDGTGTGGVAGDGIQNGSEPGIGSVTVQLKDSGGAVVGTTATDSSGYYRFDDRLTGTYSVFLPASEFGSGKALLGMLSSPGTKTGDLGDKGVDNPAPETNGIATASIAVGDGLQPTGETDIGSTAGAHGPMGDAYDNLTIDFGMVATASYPCSIGSLVWHDANIDGLFGTGESGIAGVAIEVWNDALTTLVASTTTASDGTYFVGNLAPGAYRVKIPVGNFSAGQALVTWNKSSVTTDSSDDQVDNDDNGIQTSGAGTEVLSPAITLGTSEPVDGTGAGKESGLGATLDNGGVDANGDMTVDFGFYSESEVQADLCSLGSLVWNDANNNGAWDSGEAGIAGVTLELYHDTTYWSSTTSASDGTYFFHDLPSGYSWQVRIPASNFTGSGALKAYPKTTGSPIDADNRTDSDNNGIQAGGIGTEVRSPFITITKSDERTGDDESGTGGAQDNAGSYVDANGDMTVDFGFTYIATYSLGNHVYRDPDDDGQPDLDNLDEGPIPGVIIKLFAADGNNPTGAALATAITDSAGYYRFDWLVAGTYVVVVDKVASSSLDLYRSASGASADMASSGDIYDHGRDEALASVLVGGIASWPVTLGPGLQPTGESTASGAGANGPNGDASDNLVMDFGFTPLFSVGNRVFSDANNNGIMDGTDAGISGVKLQLFTADGAGNPLVYKASVETDASGYYRFDGLPVSTYVVVVDRLHSASLTGYGSSTGASTNTRLGGEKLDHGKDTPLGSLSVLAGGIASTPVEMVAFGVVSPLGEPDVVETGLGAHGPNTDDADNLVMDFGFRQLGSITGTVMADTTGDGTGDTALSGVALTLKDSSGNDIDSDPDIAGIQPTTTTTAGDGSYGFADLVPGNYQIAETQPAGYRSLSDKDGENLDLIGNVTPVEVTVGGTNSGNDFVEEEYATITGSVKANTNFDLVGEVALPGVIVTLYTDPNNDGDPSDGVLYGTPVTTDEEGSYSFSNLLPGSYVVLETQPDGYLTLTDGDTIADIAKSPAEASNISIADNLIPARVKAGETDSGNSFVEELPKSISGTVYEDSNGDSVFGGDVPLGGVTVRLYADNDNDGVVDDGDSLLATQTTGGTGNYSFANLLNGNYLVVETDLSGYTSVTDSGEPDTYNDDDTIDVTLTNANSTGNDFLDSSTCANTWAAWVAAHPTAGGAGGNPDLDRYDNLTEFAFNQSADSGAGNAWWIQPGAGGTLDGVFVRPRGALDNVTYTLQAATTLGNPTTWEDIVIPPDMITVVYNNDCTETVTFHDLEFLTGMSTGTGFVCIKAALDDTNDGIIEATSYTEVEGWKETAVELNCSTYNNPFLRDAVFSGTVGSVSDQVLTFANNVGIAIASGTHYLEVTSGTYEGHRFDVASATGATVTLINDASLCAAGAPSNTLTGVPPQGTAPATLVGATVVIRRHWTLGEMFFPASGFHAAGSLADADQVQVFAGGAWTTYWLKDTATPTWVTAVVEPYPDRGSDVIPPGQGVFVNKRGSATLILAYGEVRANAFVRPLCAGLNLVGGGYPLTQSATGTGSRQMNLGVAPTGFFGSRDFKTADSFFIWQGDANATANGYDTYYLLYSVAPQPVMTRWVKVGDARLYSRDAEPILLGDRSVFIRVMEDTHGYIIPSPWTP